ncbi:MAG: PKD domain-containing protein [Flavobacteriales bacterium]
MKALAFFAVATMLGPGSAFAGAEGGPGALADPSRPTPRIPERFLENKGQMPGQVLYRADFGTLALFAERDRITFSKLRDDAPEVFHDAFHSDSAMHIAPDLPGHAWQMQFVGSDPNVRVTADGRSPVYANYFLGNDPSKWASDVHPYGTVQYADLWPGSDLLLHSGGDHFKYDITLDNAAAAGQVRFSYAGLDDLRLDGEGRLVLVTSVGEVTEMRPVAWYADGAKEPVECAFALNGSQVGFALGASTALDRPIVIDPLVMASTLSGTGNLGMTTNYGHCATYDDLGNIYTGAHCFGQGYPVTLGAFQTVFGGGGGDIAVSKLNPTGTALIWATYFGGSDIDLPHSMVTDAMGNFTVYGSSASTNYPCSPGAYDNTANGSGWTNDIIVSKVDASGGVLMGSTYIGGSDSDGGWYKGEVLTDATGDLFVASSTMSTNWPTTAGAFQTSFGGTGDGVVFKFNADLSSLLWSTFIGGSQQDDAYGLELDASGDVYVCGGTSSPNFPTTAGTYQTNYQAAMEGFLLRLSATGATLVSSTFFATASDDAAYFVEEDLAGDVYIYGYLGGGVPLVPAGIYNSGGSMYVAQFDPALTALICCTSISAPGGWGGADWQPIAFLVDDCDHIYVCGYSVGVSGLPLTANAVQVSGGFYLAAFDVDMSALLFATFYGGAGDHVDGGTSRFDKHGIVYQAVCTYSGFPTLPGAWSSVQPGGYDIGVFKIDFQISGVNAAGAGVINQGCAPIQIDFVNGSTGNQWLWDFGDGSALDTANTPSHTYTTPGVYTVVLIAYDSLSCNLADTISFPITIGQSQTLTAAFTAVPDADCSVSQVVTTNSSTGAPLAFIWDMGDGTQSTDTNVTHIYLGGPGSYDIELLVYDPTGCSPPDSVTQTIVVLPPDTVSAAFVVAQVPDCDELRVDCTNMSAGPGPTFLWDMGDGTTYTTTDVNDHIYAGVGTYTITLIATDPLACNQADTVTIDVTLGPPLPVVAAFNIDEVFDCAQLIAASTNTSTGSFLAFQWDMGDGTQYTDTNVTHTYTAPGTYDVVLIVSDLGGCSPSDTATVTLVVDPIEPITALFSIGQVGNCTLLTVDGVNQSLGDSVSYTWDMGDGTTYTTTDVTHVYAVPGTYTVELLVTDLGCGNDDSLSTTVTVINDLPIVAATNGVICPGLTTTILASGATGDYLWSNGYTTDSIVVAAAGSYWVVVSDGLCTGSDTVDVIEAPEFDLSYGFDACPGTPITLTVPFQGTSYLWETGETEQSVYFLFPGGDTTDYDFEVWDALGCVHDDSVTVTPMDSQPHLFAPNAFTPDGDGINDEFVITGFGENEVELLIFNRWGEQIFSTTSLTDPWNGVYNGQIKQDVYVYKLKYNGECTNDETSLIGHVTVVR